MSSEVAFDSWSDCTNFSSSNILAPSVDDSMFKMLVSIIYILILYSLLSFMIRNFSSSNYGSSSLTNIDVIWSFNASGVIVKFINVTFVKMEGV